MNIEQFERDIKNSYKTIEAVSKSEKIQKLFEHIQNEWNLDPQKLTLHELKIVTSIIIDNETSLLQNEVEELLAKKEQIQRRIDKTSHELQDTKYLLFDTIEKVLIDTNTIQKLHQIKLQSVDLFDIINEMVESAIITALEKNDQDLEETVEEVIKELTYETINEGALNSIRIRTILSNILQTAVDVAEATPNQADAILEATMRGTKAGLIKAISKFKQQLLYMPEEIKIILLSDYDHTFDELIHTDAIFTQVTHKISSSNSQQTKKILDNVSNKMQNDLQELVHISKETVDIMKERFNSIKKDALKRGSKVLKSQKAQEAKRMGTQAWGIAKSALGNAIKNAKSVIEKKE